MCMKKKNHVNITEVSTVLGLNLGLIHKVQYKVIGPIHIECKHWMQ